MIHSLRIGRDLRPIVIAVIPAQLQQGDLAPLGLLFTGPAENLYRFPNRVSEAGIVLYSDAEFLGKSALPVMLNIIAAIFITHAF